MDCINQIVVALIVQAIAASEDDRIRIVEDLSPEVKFGGGGNSMDAFFAVCLPGTISDQRSWIEACVSMDDSVSRWWLSEPAAWFFQPVFL